MWNYLVVLFKNKAKKKIVKKFVTLKKAQSFHNKLINGSKDVIFEVMTENGEECSFELGLIELSNKQSSPVYITDEFGRNKKVKLGEDNMTLLEIKKYKKEEKIFDLQTNKKIDTSTLIKKYLKNDGIKVLFTLNHKLIIQIEDKFFLFSLKNEFDTIRFLETLSNYFFRIKKSDCIFVKDYNLSQRKYFLKLLSDNGISKKILYRKQTSRPRPK